MKRLWIIFVLGLAFLGGCRHDVMLRSSPSGATVTRGGTEIGETPLPYESDIGPAAKDTFEFRLSEGEKTTDVKVVEISREQRSWTSAGQGALIGLSACCALNAVGCVLAGVDFQRFGLVVTSTSSLGLLSVLLGGTAGYMHGRTFPQEVMVNFADDRVVSSPPGLAVEKTDAGTPQPAKKNRTEPSPSAEPEVVSPTLEPEAAAPAPEDTSY
ncbi:MAG: hypothetical protein GY822_23375 [Deltaproteobacteria bacterium]|nr:hypothetical protein [Deltaproteobacteria bacterium]